MAAIQSQVSSDVETVDNGSIAISVEWVVYAVLVLLALSLRVAELDTAPLTTAEAPQAVLATGVDLDRVTSASVSISPLTYWLQRVSFTFFGVTEFAARIGTAIGSILLLLTPILFREVIGRDRALLTSIALTFTPIAFLSARYSDATIWGMTFALAGVWAVMRYWQSREMNWIYAAFGFFAAMFLSDSGSIPLTVILIISTAITILLSSFNAPTELDLPADEYRQQAWGFLQEIPWLNGFGIAFLVVLIGSTGFMLFSSGLGIVGDVFTRGIAGFWQVTTGGFSPLAGLLLYAPFVTIFGVLSAVWLSRRSQWTFITRWFAVFALVALLVGIFYADTRPAHTLWLVMPLCFLASCLWVEFFRDDLPGHFWMQQDDSTLDRLQGRRWLKWAIAVFVIGVLVMLSFHWFDFGRNLSNLLVSDGAVTNIFEAIASNQAVNLRYSFIGIVMALLILLVGGVLFVSVWEPSYVLRSIGIGVLGFMVFAQLSLGWNTAVSAASNPLEPFHNPATSISANYLQDSLVELSKRDVGGHPILDITVVNGFETTGVTESGVIGWLLRDFENVRYVDSLAEAAQDQIVIVPEVVSQPDLGGDYVGQRFEILQTWDNRTMGWNDIWYWLNQRQTARPVISSSNVILWLRQDVFNSVPPTQRVDG